MVTTIGRTKLLVLIEQGEAQIVDVLPKAEYVDSHIPGAINLPLKHLDAETATVLRTDKPVVVY